MATKHIVELYPQLAWMMKIDEAKALLLHAQKNGWSVERTYGQIITQKWWKDSSDTTRAWTQLRVEDPGTANQRIEQRWRELKDMRNQLGLGIHQSTLRELAEMSLREGWGPDDIERRMRAHAKNLDAVIRRDYGALADLMDVPEIGAILNKAASTGWGPEVTFQQIQLTDFWQTTSDAGRQWIALSAQDPAEAAKRRQATREQVHAILQEAGISLEATADNPDPLGSLVEQTLREQLTADQVQRRVLASANADSLGPLIRSEFGGLGIFFEEPAVRELLVQGVREGWSPERLQTEIEQTAWWQVRGAAVRDWQSLTMTDPGEANRRREQTANNIEVMASQLGIPLTGSRLGQLAEAALSLGWSQQELTDALISDIDFDAPQQRGSVGMVMDNLRTRTRQWAVPLADETLEAWLAGILSNRVSPEEFDLYLKNQATSQYPTLQGAIERGVTPMQYFEPYKQVAAQTLDLNPEAIDFSQPQWNRAVRQVDKDGVPSAMTLSDWERELKRDPQYGYRFTRQANAQGAQVVEGILNQFGAVA